MKHARPFIACVFACTVAICAVVASVKGSGQALGAAAIMLLGIALVEFFDD